MVRLRSLMLGSAAVLAALGSAKAADLPAAKAAPVEYVRVCSTYGAGFFYVPGTDSCLRISGRVRAEYRYVEPFTRVQDISGFRARGRLNLDHRTNTAYGLVRAYVRYEIDRNSGVTASNGQISTNPKINQAYIQFGGLTAGRVTSFFTNPDLPVENFADLRFDDPINADVALLAYTYSFGNGFSATLSLEDAIERRVNNALDFPFFGTGSAVPVFAPIPFTYGGERIPDVVANLRYTGTWGGAQLSGALHQIRDVASGIATINGVPTPVINPITGLPNPTFTDTDYGFAISANAYVNMPYLGVGDQGWISATYTDGAVGYINAGQSSPIYNAFISAGPLAMPFTDAFVDPYTGNFNTTKAYGIAGGINHNWTPTIHTNIHGSWMRFDAPAIAQYVVPASAATIALGTAGTTTGVVDFNEYKLGVQGVWTPVTGILFGVEALYTIVDPRGRVAVPISTATGNATGFYKSSGTGDIWEGRLRIQRDF